MSKLNTQEIKGLTPKAARYEVPDGGGLYVVVQKSGVKSFQLRGKGFRKALGQFPAMSLRDARMKRDELKVAIRSGETIERRGAKIVPEAAPVVPEDRMTVEQAWDLYMADEGSKRTTAKAKETFYAINIHPAIGSKALLDVTHEDIEDVVQAKYDDALEVGEIGISANRLLSHIKRFTKWCLTKGRSKTGLRVDPAIYVVKRCEEQSRERFLSEDELKLLFRALPVAGDFAPGFELLLRTLSRRTEIMGLRKDMVKHDDELGTYLDLPTTHCKNGVAHVIYLPESAAKLIPANLRELNRDTVFDVNPLSTSKPMARIMAKLEALCANAGIKFERFTLHDLRRTGASNMGRLKVGEHIIPRLLNHTQKGVTATYNRFAYADEKREALTRWNDYLDKIKAEALA